MATNRAAADTGPGVWTIAEVARSSGITSRTLRHYDEIGLLPAERSANGYRVYDQAALVRLQRILLLRQFGMPLTEIAALLAGPHSEREDLAALRDHLARLRADRRALTRQIRAVATTIAQRENGQPIMPEQTFDGFDHTQYREEVVDRWGEDAYRRSDGWWRGLSTEQRKDFLAESRQLAADWTAAAAAGLDPAGVEAAALARRHAAWVARSWGGSDVSDEALQGLAQMYVADDRFAANYGGIVGATFVRDAIDAWLTRQ